MAERNDAELNIYSNGEKAGHFGVVAAHTGKQTGAGNVTMPVVTLVNRYTKAPGLDCNSVNHRLFRSTDRADQRAHHHHHHHSQRIIVPMRVLACSCSALLCCMV